MSAKKKSKNGAARLDLSGELTIYGAVDLKRRLLEALVPAAELEVNLSRVTEIDTAAIQLLILAKREAQAAGKSLRLTAHSAASTEALDLLHLGGYFGDPVVLTARN